MGLKLLLGFFKEVDLDLLARVGALKQVFAVADRR